MNPWIVLLLICAVAQATLQIVPGATWTATNTGEHIQAHGAGVFKSGSTYYLVGEDHTDGSAFMNINCYSSTDLVNWSYVGALLTRQSSGDLGPNRVVERPKVIYNSATGKYVLWMHIDDSSYSEAKVGVATGSSVCGSYDYLGSWQPLGYQSRDMGLFQDDDGTAYLLSEDRVNGLRVDELTSDYLNVSKATYLFEDLEAPAMIKKNGVYFIFASHLSGWAANDNVYATATNINGPWSSFTTFATPGSNTYNSQTNYILPVGDHVMYLGDRWVSTNLMTSTYVWLPLNLSGTNASMSNHASWPPSTFSAGPATTQNDSSTAILSNGAKLVPCSGCSASTAAGYIGGPSDGTALFANVSSTATTESTITIDYENGDALQRFANVSVNGAAPRRLAFLPTPDGNTPGSSVLNVALDAGWNEVRFAGFNASYAPDVDRLVVPVC